MITFVAAARSLTPTASPPRRPTAIRWAWRGPVLLNRKGTGRGQGVDRLPASSHRPRRFPAVVRTADLVHALAAAMWVDGLVGSTITARGVDTRKRSITVARFSTWATGAVAGVALGGVALAEVNLRTVAWSWETGHGRLLLAKLPTVAGRLTLGTYDHFNGLPGVTTGDSDAAASPRAVVRWELALVAVVVALTALPVETTPL